MSLIKALISERTMNVATKNRYTFEVGRGDTKTDIKKMVEKTFGVKVLNVATSTMRGKTYRTGKKWVLRKRPDKKKAVVTTESGKTIDLFETTKTQA